jgi:hypothetical protein
MTRMSEKRIEKIGSKTLLDKAWADKPLNVIRNPHKLSEVELHKTLEKIVELPEKRLKSMLKQGDKAIDEVFMQNIAERIPQFLTATVVNLTTTLLVQKDYFRDHPIWPVLEVELFKRRRNLNNEQLTSVLHAFGISGNGSKTFFHEMEEVVTDSQVPIETDYLVKVITGYAEIDLGSPELYSMLIEKIIQRDLSNIEPVKRTEIAKTLSKATNVSKGGFGFYLEMEKSLKSDLHQGRMDFSELCKSAENILSSNVGTNKFHDELEQFLVVNYDDQNVNEIVSLIKGLSLYQIKNEELNQLIFRSIFNNIENFSVKQLEILLWSFSRKQLAHDPNARIATDF